MSENEVPRPETMGEHLDQELKETVQEWAENPEGGQPLDDRIDQRLRRMVAGWVGVDQEADWKTIGGQMDSKTRAAIGGWVGADEGADWGAISSRMENRIRLGVARLVKARKEQAAEAAPETSWGDIGAKVEHDVRGWVAALVGTQKEADWKTIGDQVVTQVKHAVDKISESLKKEDKADKPYPESEKIVIEGEEPVEPPQN